MARDAAVSVRIDPDIKAALEQVAEADGRTVSSYVERLIKAHLEEMRPEPARAKPKRRGA